MFAGTAKSFNHNTYNEKYIERDSWQIKTKEKNAGELGDIEMSNILNRN